MISNLRELCGITLYPFKGRFERFEKLIAKPTTLILVPYNRTGNIILRRGTESQDSDHC